MRHYLFEIDGGIYDGEQFIVYAQNVEDAKELAAEYMEDDDVRYICELSDEEAEASGLDEY